MKKYLLIGFALLMLAARLPAQNGIVGNLNAATTTCLVSNSCLILDVPQNAGGATIKLSGTWSATVQFEATADPLTVLPTAASWVALSATPSNSATTATSSTANGAWQVNISGYQRIRIRISAYTSGTVAGAINLSTASARGGSGGGGGGGGSIGGSIAATQIAFGSGANTIAGDALFTFDSTGHAESIGSTNPDIPGGQVNNPDDVFVRLLSQTDTSATSTAAPVMGYGYDPSGLTSFGGIFNAYSVTTGTATGIQPTATVSPNNGQTVTGAGALNIGARGVDAFSENLGAGTVVGMVGLITASDNFGTGTVTRAIGVDFQPNANTGGGAITNAYGAYFEAQSAATNNYGAYFNDFGAGATTYGIFQAGANTKNVLSNIQSSTYSTTANCANTASPAVCTSAAAGAVVVAAAATTVVVNTSAVTANSEIFIQYDSSLGTRLSVTCNTTVALPAVTARVAATSFTVTVPVAPITNPACYSYHIVN